MRTFYLFRFCCLILVPLFFAKKTSAAPSRVLDLETCYRLALRQSESMKILEAEVRAAQARYRQAIGSILPQITLSGNAARFSNSLYQNQNFNFSTGNTLRESYALQLNVKQPLFNGFREFYGISARKSAVRSNRHMIQRKRQTLYLDVASVFYQILHYQKDGKLLLKMQKTLEKRVKELEHFVEIGRSRLGEVIQAKTQLAETKVAQEKNRGLYKASLELLSFLIGRPSRGILLSEKTPLPSAAALKNYLQSSQARPDILAAREDIHSAKNLLKAKQGEFYPSINLEGNLYAYDDPQLSRDWSVFLSVTIPIFSGGTTYHGVKERKEILKKTRLTLQALKRSKDKDIRSAYENFNTAIAQVVQLREVVTLSKQNFDIQREDYKLSRVNNLNVLDANQRWYASLRNLASAETDARVHLVRLHVASGKIKK